MNFRQSLQMQTRLGLLAAAFATGLVAAQASDDPTGRTTARSAALLNTANTSQSTGPLVGIGSEDNLFPFSVTRHPADASERVQLAGPLLFSTRKSSGETIAGLRPFWLQRNWPAENRSETDLLYPLFVYRSAGDRWTWSILNLINRHSPQGPALGKASDGFDIWPFYFSRKAPNPADSYRALFPLFGPLKNRLFNDRIDWVLFPLYGRFQKDQRVTTTTPWPFFRTTHGGGHSGWALWPLYGHREQAGVFRTEFWLWPFAYNNVSGLDLPEGPTRSRGLLPLYTEERGPGIDRRIYLWPFFGTTHETKPLRYDETRYFWPFLLQGRGQQVYRNRWAPVYSHSEIRGVSKTWILWPLWRDQSFTESHLDQRKRQFLYFLYWDIEQRKAGSPAGGPVASKTHLWPLYSAWNNGDGTRQLQVLSPFEVFFIHNDTIRHSWSPLFALYRRDARGTDYARHSLLWDAVSYERSRSTEASRFVLGPLLRTESSSGGAKRVSLLCGLLGLKREAGASWKPFLLDFKKRPAPLAAPTP